jgi:DNA-binding transcriptional regulator YhcF (GntR family)
MKKDLAENVSGPPDSEPILAYKFQRLREDLRKAIANREFEGKLPGERTLAQHFRVNAKTLSKALMELTAEGLLDRTVGVGTFTKGSTPKPSLFRRWLVLCDADTVDSKIIQSLRKHHTDLEILSEWTAARPSLLNRFGVVIILTNRVTQSLIFDLILRNISVIVVGSEPERYSTHAVVFDRQLAVSVAGDDLLSKGHRRFAVLEPSHSNIISSSLRQALLRHAVGTKVQDCLPEDSQSMLRDGVTAFVCHSVKCASMVKHELESCGATIPKQASVLAVSFTDDDPSVSGFFLSGDCTAAAITRLVEKKTARPSTIWLPGHFIDHGTVSTLKSAP